MVTVVARVPGDDGHVRLGLGCVVERDGSLDLHGPARTEREAERLSRKLDRDDVRAVPGLLEQHVPGKQLDALVGADDLGVGEPVVLDTRPFPSVDDRLERVSWFHHRRAYRRAPRSVNVSASIRWTQRTALPARAASRSARA
jgi:hypothetical protein